MTSEDDTMTTFLILCTSKTTEQWWWNSLCTCPHLRINSEVSHQKAIYIRDEDGVQKSIIDTNNEVDYGGSGASPPPYSDLFMPPKRGGVDDDSGQ